MVGGHLYNLATNGRKGGHQTLLLWAHTHHRSCCKLESQKFETKNPLLWKKYASPSFSGVMISWDHQPKEAARNRTI